jgi:hypothetical protein
MDQKDFTIPRVDLVQPTSKKYDAKLIGSFVFNTGETVPMFKGCKLIVPTKTRVLYAGEGRARCKSDNFYAPSEHVKNPVSSNCLTCPASDWGQNDVKDGIAREVKPRNYDANKPLCNETYNLLMADESWNLFFIKFQKSQLGLVNKKLFTRLRYNYGKDAPYTVAFDMVPVKTDTYYVVEFENFRVIPDDQKQIAQDCYMQWSKRAGDVLKTQHEEMDLSKHDLSDDEPPF